MENEENTYYLSNGSFEEKLLQGRSNPPFYKGFVKTTLSYQIRTSKWYETMMKDPENGDPLCTPSDEAFVILNVLNLRNYWLKKWSGGPVTASDMPLYTKKKGTSRDAQGWSQEGIQRFNDLMKHVKDDRFAHQQFDRNYRIETQNDMAQKKRKRKRNTNTEDRTFTQLETDEDLFLSFVNNAGSI